MKDCNQCGKCCLHYGDGGLSATKDEIEQWEIHRPDIARYVQDGRIWIDPETDEVLSRCPWLTRLPGQPKYTCEIYEDRPADCRYYPVDIQQMLRDDCEMLERRDLLNPTQAQKKLDLLMSDSRPSISPPVRDS